MKLRLLAGILCVCATSAYAQQPPPGQGPRQNFDPQGSRPNQEQRLNQIKSMLRQANQAEQQVLQSAAACISGVTGHEQLRTCHEQKHRAMEQIRASMQALHRQQEPGGGSPPERRQGGQGGLPQNGAPPQRL